MVMPKQVNGRPVKTGSWLPEEDALLAEWQGQLGNRWSAVAKRIPGRTGQQCAQRWRHKVNPNIRKEKWTEEEDGRLMALVREYGNAWAEISRRMDGRTDQQCMGRWRRHLDPGIRRDAWKGGEDETLLALYQRHGSQWSAIAKALPGRTAQQCRARWFQVEAGEEPGSSRGAPSSRKPGARSSRARPAWEGEDSDCCEGGGSPPPSRAGRRLAAVREEAEWGSGASEGGGSGQSTPLRRARAPARRLSEAQPPSGRSSGTALHSAGTARPQRSTRGRRRPQQDWQSGDEEEASATPESRPSSAAAARRQPSSELASPPFLSQEGRPGAGSLDPRLLSPGLAQLTQAARSPSQRLLSPAAQHTRGPRSYATPGKSLLSPQPPLSGKKRGTPGSACRLAEAGWDTSPQENVLHLLASPQQPSARRGSNPLQSPSFQSLTTPDWAKRDERWMGEAAQPAEGAEAAEEPFPRSLSRGPVARRLDVESALRGSASGRCPDKQPPLHALVAGGRAPLCSPAKKQRSSLRPAAEAATPTRLQGERLQEGEAEAPWAIADAKVTISTMSDSESSALNALKQLSMGAFGGESPLQPKQLLTPPGEGRPGSRQRTPLADRPCEAGSNGRSSAAVRMRLHALLEGL